VRVRCKKCAKNNNINLRDSAEEIFEENAGYWLCRFCGSNLIKFFILKEFLSELKEKAKLRSKKYDK